MEIDLFDADYKRELYEIENEPEEERQEMIEFYSKKGLSKADTRRIVSSITKSKTKWLEDMLLNEVHVHKDELGSPIQAGATMGLACLVGGFVPLAPYVFVGSLPTAITTSIIIAYSSLFIIGSIKGKMTKNGWVVK